MKIKLYLIDSMLIGWLVLAGNSWAGMSDQASSQVCVEGGTVQVTLKIDPSMNKDGQVVLKITPEVISLPKSAAVKLSKGGQDNIMGSVNVILPVVATGKTPLSAGAVVCAVSPDVVAGSWREKIIKDGLDVISQDAPAHRSRKFRHQDVVTR